MIEVFNPALTLALTREARAQGQQLDSHPNPVPTLQQGVPFHCMGAAPRTKVVDDALWVVGEGERLRRLELQRQVLPQRADQQELVRLLGDLRG